jgi:mRNA deadenylase 3'-5' endonuclease subunit Ccr4
MTDIRILTYNVLAAVFVKKQYYPNTPSNLLDYQNRREHTLRLIQNSSADFVMLQEAQEQDRFLFEKHFPSAYGCSPLGKFIRINH